MPGPDHASAVPVLSIRALCKTYGAGETAVRALRDVDLDIAAGEFVVLLGASGSGKSTLLNILGGLDRPTTGDVRFLEHRLTDADDDELTRYRREHVGFVFQFYNLIPSLTVHENVALVTDIASDPMPADEALALVALTPRRNHFPAQLSGGEQQRVALARALVNRPRALLLDEPLGALDLKLRQAMQIELKRIQREVGITFVYVTHDQGEALTMSDRIAVMNAGVIEQLAGPRDIYEKPATKFVAGFIGTSNLLSGTVSRADAAGVAVIEPGDGQRILVPARGAGAELHPGDAGEITVRPEKITLSATPPPATACALRGTVSEVVYLGTSTSYNVTTSIGAEVVVFVQNTHNASDAAARGDAVWLSWDPAHSYAIGSPV
jgi:spermidine/putrescine transport system ATP-binding protein